MRTNAADIGATAQAGRSAAAPTAGPTAGPTGPAGPAGPVEHGHPVEPQPSFRDRVRALLPMLLSLLLLGAITVTPMLRSGGSASGGATASPSRPSALVPARHRSDAGTRDQRDQRETRAPQAIRAVLTAAVTATQTGPVPAAAMPTVPVAPPPPPGAAEAGAGAARTPARDVTGLPHRRGPPTDEDVPAPAVHVHPRP